MRVLSFMNSYSYGLSGSDVVLIRIAPQVFKDFNQTVITSRMGRLVCEKNDFTPNFIVTTKEERFKSIIWTYIKRIFLASLSVLREPIPNICFASSDFLPDVFPCFLLKLKNPDTLWVQHIYHSIPRQRVIPFLAQRISFILIRFLADKVVVDNKILKQDLIEMGFKPSRLYLNYPGLDFEKFENLPEPKKEYTASFIAQLRRSKGVLDLPEIWAHVVKDFPDANLAIIGSGTKELLEELKQRILFLDLQENIDVLGFLPNKEAFSIIKDSDVFVFPSYEEGFGLAPLEAQACGTPVVARDLPVYEEIFPEGMVKASLGDYRGFWQAVLEVLVDPRLADDLVEACHVNSALFSWSKTISREKEILELA
ncbi:glycosyltransferase [candidate division WWE3 bacterium]|nr:glycosyltransferase [candidate division WWE3 bacterium]